MLQTQITDHWIRVILLTTLLRLRLCEAACQFKEDTNAICSMNSEADFATALPSSIHTLRVHYSGPLTSLNGTNFSHYHRIEVLEISGNISYIEARTFKSLTRLTSLSITETKITDLPDDLFDTNNTSLQELNLRKNRLEKIPLALFKQLNNLEVLNVADNCIRAQPCDSIGEEFRNLTKLSSLNIAGLTIDLTCRSLVPMFFNSVNKNLTHLNMSSSNIVNLYSKYALNHFTALKVLDLSEIATMSTCPKNGWFFFFNLPKTLTKLYIQRWRSIHRPRSTCFMDSRTLSGLKTLPNLEELYMRHSDSIFGPTLHKQTFAGFNALKFLDIGWCRIWNIEYFAFDKCPLLERILLDGNPIGSKTMRLQLKWKNIRHLSLRHIRVSFDRLQTIFPAVRLQFSSILTSIDLSNNFLHRSPLYSYRVDGKIQWKKADSCHLSNSSEVAVRYSPELIFLNLNDNHLTHFLPEEISARNLIEICTNISGLTSLYIENNELEFVTGLCPSIEILKLKNNRIGNRWKNNTRALSLLWKLKNLDLSGNLISCLTADLFSNMTDLSQINFQNNNITYLQSDLFINNKKLTVMNFAFNQIANLDAILINHLYRVTLLDIRQNSLTQFAEEFLDSLDQLSLQVFDISGNKFSCNCDQRDTYFRDWLTRYDRQVVVPDYQQLRCNQQHDQAVHTFIRDTFTCDWIFPTILVPAIMASIALTVVIILPCYKYRWFVSHPKLLAQVITKQLKYIQFDRECKYDAFVSYNNQSDKDTDFVINSLLPSLENQNAKEPCRLFIHDRDAAVGAPRHTELGEVLAKSRKVLVVLSNSYLSSSQCRGDADLAGRDTYGARHYQPGRILVIIRERLDEDKIVPPITTLLTESTISVYDINNTRVMKKVWERIRSFVIKSKHAYNQAPVTDSDGTSNESDTAYDIEQRTTTTL